MNSRNSEHYDDSEDMIARIHKLREAAEKKMNAFGDPADYDMRIIHGRKNRPEIDDAADMDKCE